MNSSMKNPKLTMLGLLVLIVSTILLSLNLGSIHLAPLEVVQTLFGGGTAKNELVLFDLRLPRILLALFIGAGLAIAGTLLQAVSENDLAEPGIIGINAGAGFGVVVYLLFSHSSTLETLSLLKILSIPLAAILGGMLAATITYSFASRNGLSPIRLILIGIAVNAGFNAIIIYCEMKLDSYGLTSMVVWLSGSIWVSNWSYVWSTLPWLLVLIPIVLFRAKTLDIMKLGDHTSIGLGVTLQRERKLFLLIAVILTGVCVSIGGGIAFVGLIAPHLARRLVGVNHHKLIPTALLLGALLVLVADTLGKNLMDANEIPVGLLIAVIGAPYFIYLLMKAK
ncbi:iron ABC transporter permease [Paenibacillus psychroresistens]|uniref:Iron ABC transporter permease n=1 Tax=Paenibacillus psychroresistens TaxID=1778678 RepID=A0A6B8RG49_9BACL|nr:iron ABC transporter permease [Paenibacillus psychroresistens]QGQ94555.1 iron ABC transporter permease [Paenibacillus psychroresistens]